jgi:outer membrane receptor protein involved in Fe transport
MTTNGFVRRVVMALLVLVAVLFQETWALAGTTGGLSGTVTDETGAPVADASVRASSASQNATARTDRSGHFVFISLAPDTYSISIEKEGYAPVSYAGVTVFADQTQTLAFHMQKALQTIARVTSTAASALVKSGTTSDLYSVNSATAAKVSGLGGGGGLDNAYSAIATMPGAYVPVGQAGWYQNVYIRGGDYDQVGYEVDGVPVNRSFDNYPSNTATSLGQQEVQVYTGASPADSQGQGLAGYINQVIKTGTYPGYASSDLGVGTPTFYHKANVEVGGASPDRNFSYYVGIGGYNQDYRYYNQYNGASLSNSYGPAFTPCPATPAAGLPSCSVNGTWLSGRPGGVETPGFALGPYNVGNLGSVVDRDSVVNFHFGIPHHKDGGRDDIQVLYETSQITQYYTNSINDWSGLYSNPALFGTTQIPYASGAVYTGQLNQPIDPSTVGSQMAKYQFPYAQGANLPTSLEDNEGIDDAIFKVQYQKNFGSNAYLRVYGYTDYSNWLNYGPNTASQPSLYGIIPPIYQVNSHTRGVSAEFADQINPSNLLQFQMSYTTATSGRTYDQTAYQSLGQQLGTLVNANAPDSGVCYTVTGSPTGCSVAQGYAPENFTVGDAFTGKNLPTSMPASCGGGPCEFLATANGYFGEYNTVTPRFSSGALTDQWQPNDRLNINVGVRYDNYTFIPGNTNIPGSSFWFSSWNNSMCYNTAQPGSTPVALPSAAFAAGATAANGACQSYLGSSYVQAALSNTDTPASFSVWQPRVGLTYTLNPQNVLRASYGRYDQAPNTAFEQYGTLQADLPDYLGPTFYAYGRTSSTFPIQPEISNNYDLSWEHQFKGTDMSFKLTPFYRKTQNQIEQFYLNVQTNFVSGLNIGSQTNEGVEFQFQKGDFNRNGFSGLLSFTYTNAYVNYGTLPTGGTVLSTINNAITNYNSYTKARGGVPCYAPATGGGAGTPISNPAACTSADIANPYYNQPVQPLMSSTANYAPYDLFPFTPGAGSYSSFVTPYVATLVLNYKHNKLAITPALQFSAGNRYGYPLAETGYNPSTCSAATGFGIGQVYYGSAGGYGNAANPASCTGTLSIPDISTGQFDNIGAFVNPSRYTLSTQISYDVNPHLTIVATLANLLDLCSGGTKAAWTNIPGVSSSSVCGYSFPEPVAYTSAAIGNTAPLTSTGGELAQPIDAYGYAPTFGSLPFNAFIDFKLKM